MAAVSGRSRGATAAGHGLDDHDWMGDDWMAALETTAQVTQIHARAPENEKWKSTAGARPGQGEHHCWNLKMTGWVMTGWALVMTGWLST